jgi:glycosyltransferase involved in cell wall biosynthesis
MKILFLPNWRVHFLTKDQDDIQAPDKYVRGKPYWFFKYMPDVKVDIIDFQKQNILHLIEKKYLKNYFYQSLKAFLKRKNYDVIISHGAQSGLFYSLLASLFNMGNNPLHVIIDIGGMNGSRINHYETPFIRMALKSKPAIIYHAKSQIELYNKAYPELLPISRFIQFGVDIEYFAPKNVETENIVLSFGYYKRDYDTLIRAWGEVQTDARLKIIGTEGKTTDRVLYSGKVSINQLKEEITKSLFVVIPLQVFNYSYGQMSFLQSMAMGKPVIVTKTPSSVDYLIDGQGTYFVDPYNVNDMAEKIHFLLSHQESLSEFGALARKQIVDQLDEKIMAINMYEFIIEQLNK